MRYSFFLFTIVLSLTVQAQKNFTLSGHVQDESSGEQLIGATIYAKEVNTGVGSNIYGFYSLTLPANSYTILVSFIGYNTQGGIS